MPGWRFAAIQGRLHLSDNRTHATARRPPCPRLVPSRLPGACDERQKSPITSPTASSCVHLHHSSATVPGKRWPQALNEIGGWHHRCKVRTWTPTLVSSLLRLPRARSRQLLPAKTAAGGGWEDGRPARCAVSLRRRGSLQLPRALSRRTALGCPARQANLAASYVLAPQPCRRPRSSLSFPYLHPSLPFIPFLVAAVGRPAEGARLHHALPRCLGQGSTTACLRGVVVRPSSCKRQLRFCKILWLHTLY